MDNIKKFEDFLDRMQGLLDNAKKQGHIIVRVEDLENAFPELKESKNEEKPNGGIVLEDFNEGEGFYKVNLAYLNKEQVEKVEELVKKWNPELAESESERIRRKIVAALCYYRNEGCMSHTECNECRFWLEKQGDKKSIWHNEDEEPKRDSLILLIMQSGNPIVAKIIEPNHTFNHGERWAYIDDLLEKQDEHQKFRDSIQVGDRVTRNEDGVLVNISQLNRVAKREEPAYTKEDVDAAYLEGLRDAKSTEIKEDPCEGCDHKVKNCQNFPCYRKKAFDEQKPVWSEEDEELYREALVAFASLYNEVDPVVDWGKLYSWFKSLKGKIQPQPKQEWSEEDSVRLQRIIDFLWHNRKGDTDTIYQQEQDIDWLKSLRPQNRCAYNPYKAVVDSIAEMCKHYGKANHSGLRDFYDNVKVKCKDAKEYDSLYPQNGWKPNDEQKIKVCKEVYADVLSAKGFALSFINNELNRLEEQLRKQKD